MTKLQGLTTYSTPAFRTIKTPSLVKLIAYQTGVGVGWVLPVENHENE